MRKVALVTGVEVVCSNLFYTSERAQKDLGWSFRPGRDAIGDGVRWYRELGWV